MYEYEIFNSTTEEYNIIFGYSYEDAARRSGINQNEWSMLSMEYID